MHENCIDGEIVFEKRGLGNMIERGEIVWGNNGKGAENKEIVLILRKLRKYSGKRNSMENIQG